MKSLFRLDHIITLTWLEIAWYTRITQQVCIFCNGEKKTNTHGYCGACWSQLEKIESDGDIVIRLDKTLDNE